MLTVNMPYEKEMRFGNHVISSLPSPEQTTVDSGRSGLCCSYGANLEFHSQSFGVGDIS